MNLYSKEKSHLSSLHLCMTPEMALSSLCYTQIFSFAQNLIFRSAYHHSADHLRYHKNHKSADQHLKCFYPLQLLHQKRKHRRCQHHTAQQIESPCRTMMQNTTNHFISHTARISGRVIIARTNFNSHRIAFISFLWPAYSPWPALFWAASAYCLSLPFYKTQKAGRFIAASGPKLFIGCGWGKSAQPVYRVTFLGSTNGTTCATASCRVRGDWLLSRSISLYLRLPMPSSCM